MKSFASVDRIEGEFAVLEVEIIEVEESDSVDYFDKDTEMMDFPVEKIIDAVGTVQEGDILVVEHDGNEIIEVLYQDKEEKNARTDILGGLI